MTKKRKIILTACVAGVVLLGMGAAAGYYHYSRNGMPHSLRHWWYAHIDSKQVATKQSSASLLTYCKRHQLDTECYITVDFTRPSSEPRLEVRRFDNGKVLFSSLCAHGDGLAPFRSTASDPHFSNRAGSKCSSVGRYVLTGTGKSNKLGFRIIKLEGLDTTNSNALRRGIYIHSSGKVTRNPSEQLIPVGFKTSEGCFVVTSGAFQRLVNLMQCHPRMLLYAFNRR